MTLTETTRIDGLRIAGHVCYRDGAYDLATEAFTELNSVSTNPRWKAEALRMLAQLSMNNNDLEHTIELFKGAWEQAIIDDPIAQFESTKSILNLVCALSESTGEHEQSLDYAMMGAALFHWDETPNEKAQFVYRIYSANKHLGNNEAALYNLNDLLINRPDFQADNHLMGIPPMLRLDVFELQGNGWEKPTEAFIYEVIDVCHDPRYIYMPSRLMILKKFGSFLEDQNQNAAAIHIRSSLREELDDAISSDLEIDPFLKSNLLHNLAYLALDDARLSIELGEYTEAVAASNYVISNANELQSHLVDKASTLHSQAQAQAQSSHPDP